MPPLQAFCLRPNRNWGPSDRECDAVPRLFHYVASQAFHPYQKLPQTWLEELTVQDRTRSRPP